jgi:hypothetical protein
VTVSVKVLEVDPEAFVPVIVYTVAPATVFGVPVNAPVEVLNVIPGGVDEMENEAIAPPVELIVKPVAVVLTVLVSADDESVNAGAATKTVKVKV